MMYVNWQYEAISTFFLLTNSINLILFFYSGLVKHETFLTVKNLCYYCHCQGSKHKHAINFNCN